MNGYVAGVNSAGVFLGKMNGAYTAVASAATPVSLNTWYHLKVVARGTSIAVYLDDMATPKISVTDASYATGQIGVRSHFAHSQFDNVVSSPIVADDFADGNDTGWIRYGGSWSVSGGVYDVAAGASGKSLIGDAALGNYTIEADVKALDSLQGGLVFRATAAGAGADAMNGYFVGLNSGAVILGKMNGSYTPVASTPMTLTTGSSYHVKVVAYGSKIAVYVTDMASPKISVVDTSHAVGQVGFRSHFAHTQFDNLVVR